MTAKEPYKDLIFFKSLKAYANVNESLLKGVLQKFLQHLWYLTDEMDEETKFKMLANLQKKYSTYEKRCIPLKEELCSSLYCEFDALIL